MREPVVREHGDCLAVQEPVTTPESAAPRELKTLGYAAGAQRVRPNRTDRSGLFGGLVVAQLASQLGLEGGETDVHFGSTGPAGTEAEGAAVGSQIHLSVGPDAMFTPQGQRLAAHELSHLAQSVDHSGNGDPTARAEADADRVASALVAGQTAAPAASRGPGVHAKAAHPKTQLTESQVRHAVAWYDKSGYSKSKIRKIQAKVGTIVDGDPGPMTVRAIAAWQAAHGLYVDGLAGPITLGAMFPKAPAKAPAKGPPKKPAPVSTPPAAGSTIDQKMAWWSQHAPKADYRRVTFRGIRVNRRTVELIERAEAIMRDHFDHHKFRFSFSQGSYHQGYGPSGGTHDGGGALDIRTRGYSAHVVDDMVRSMRLAGFAAWSRGRGHDSFSPHLHGVAIGDKEASYTAKNQVKYYGQHQNGLSNHAKDADRKLGAKPPEWAKKHL